jgi:hypothetical protein
VTAERRDLRVLGEVVAIVVVTWLLLGWLFDRAIEQADATVLTLPYIAGQLHGGVDWTNQLYRFGVIGGSEMQPIGGMWPLVQLCAALGVSATTTLNALTCVLQILLGALGIKTAEALATSWRGSPRRLAFAERVVTTWLVGFAPFVGWRLGMGDDNHITGLLPLVAVTTLAWCARAGTLTATVAAVAAIAVAQGVSMLAQSAVYGATFGLPIVVAAFARRWTRAEWAALAVCAGGALIMLPRVAGMIDQAIGGDAARSIGMSVTYSYNTSTWADWLGSVPWTRALAHGDPTTLHEQNIPVGPLVVMIAATREARRLGAVVLACAVVAILFANDVWPASALAHLPLVGAFRVPARAVLPALVMIAPLAVAAFAARRDATPASTRRDLLAVAVAAALIVAGRTVPGELREAAAWLACAGIVVALRREPRAAFPAFALAGALGVAAFDERLLRDVPHERIEHLTELHDAAIAAAPELASRLTRVEVVDPPPPYDMSTAWAADLSTLDGVWYPPRRFLELLSAIKGRAVPATACVFGFAHDGAFRVLQQMYDVRVALAFKPGGVALDPLPRTNGAAWFPARVEVAPPDAIGAALRASVDLRADLAATAWRDDPDAVASRCSDARVGEVTTDSIGQHARIAVTTASPCTLVVATNYAPVMVASDQDGTELPTFPIDIALTGVEVPAHATAVELEARPYVPWWSIAGAVVGALLLAVSVVLVRIRAPGSRPASRSG